MNCFSSSIDWVKKKKKKPTTTTTTTGEEVWRHKLNRVEECLVTLKKVFIENQLLP